MKKSNLALSTFIRARRTDVAHPLCLLCGRPVDSEELVEGSPGDTEYARVLVKHHGQEELRTFNFEKRSWNEEDLARFMHAASWFDPRTETGAGVLIVGARK